MGRITVHEFITLDGVIEDPSWTFDYPFDPKMGEAIAAVRGSSRACSSASVPTSSSRRRGRAVPPRKIPALPS